MSDQDEILKICSALQYVFLGGFLVSSFFIFFHEIPREYAYLYLALFISFVFLPLFLADPVSEGDES